MKKKMMKILTLLLVMFLPHFVSAASSIEPVYVDGDLPIFYANGTAITISEDEGNTFVSYGTTSVKISPKTTVFGGGVAGTSFDTSSITMTGGTVASLVGGGDGSPTEEAKVGTATIKVSGGNVAPVLSGGKYVKGTVIGGGILYSSVENANIEITGGTVFTVLGGGLSSATYNGVKSDAGTKANPEESKNRTGNVVIKISGGIINFDHPVDDDYGLVYGGGQGYSYTKKTEITISGNADLSKAWVVAGGSNGRTDDAVINVNGGKIYTLQTINRGSMKNARVNVTAGKVDILFAGGESPEKFDNDIVNGGFLGNIIVDITGGTVTDLKLGSNYDAEIAKDAKYVKVFYEPTSVTNSSSLEATMGTIANPYKEKNTVVEETQTDTVITSDLLAALKETDNTYTLAVGQKYDWTFKGSDIVDSTINVNTEITFTTEAPAEIKDGIDKQITDLKLTNVSFLNFAHEGKLPGKAKVAYNVADTYDDGVVLYVSHYNETTNKLENEQEVTVIDGKILIEIDTCSSYVVSPTKISNATTNSPIENPQTGDINILLLITIIVISVGSLTLVFKKAYNLMK